MRVDGPPSSHQANEADQTVLMVRYLASFASVSTLFYLLSSVTDYIAIFFLALASVLSIPTLIHSARFVRRKPHGHNALRHLAVLAPSASILTLPFSMVLLLGEAGSPFWYVVYIAFFPGGLLISAHIGLALAAGVSTAASRTPLYIGLIALTGSVGSLVLTTSVLYLQNALSHPFGLGLLALGLIADLLLLVSAPNLMVREAKGAAHG